MAEKTAEPRAIPLTIDSFPEFVAAMNGIDDEKVYAISGEHLNRLRNEVGRRESVYAIARQERTQAQNDREAAMAQFADLKERLHNAETAVARYEGYIDRVAEDDSARDGFHTFPDIVAEARPARPMRSYRGDGYAGGAAPYGSASGIASSGQSGSVEPRKRRVHWTSY